MSEFSFKKDLETIYLNENFWYCLTDGGYINPSDVLDNPDQIDELNKAIQLISKFEFELIRLGILGEC